MSTDRRIAIRKRSLRDDMRRRLRAIDRAAAEDAARGVHDIVTARPEWSGARAIFVYLALPGELALTPVIAAALEQGKLVAAPRIDWSKKQMTPVRLLDLDRVDSSKQYNIPEPIGNERVPLDMIDIALIPALAYDLSGRRLGRGGGFYDRFLVSTSLCPSLRTVGVAYDAQLVDSVPNADHDIPVQSIVTPTRWIDCDGESDAR